MAERSAGLGHLSDMRQLAIIAFAALAACARSEPVDESRQVEDGASVIDTSAEEAAGEESANTASPALSSGFQWFARTDERGPWAGYGPPNSETVFSARCEGDEIVFSTTDMPPSGPGETQMQLNADGISETLIAQASEEGLPQTQASAPADAQWLSQLASTAGNLTVTVGVSGPQLVPISEELVSLIEECGR